MVQNGGPQTQHEDDPQDQGRERERHRLGAATSPVSAPSSAVRAAGRSAKAGRGGGLTHGAILLPQTLPAIFL